MCRTHRYITSLFLVAALATPLATIASPRPQDDRDSRTSKDSRESGSNTHRVYDAKHKEYHNWDDNENRAWNRYLSENHKKDHAFAKASKKEQEEYWDWRHDHPDNDRDNDRRDH